jgi:hypothetical protein
MTEKMRERSEANLIAAAELMKVAEDQKLKQSQLQTIQQALVKQQLD